MATLQLNGSARSNRKFLVSGAAVLAVAAAAYGLGRVYPPLGPTAGTVAPAERYVSSQIGAGDVTLGDTAIPKLMQTDAFEVIVTSDDVEHAKPAPDIYLLACERLGVQPQPAK